MAVSPEPFGVVFVDIGGTLSTVLESEDTKRLEPFATLVKLFQTLRGTCAELRNPRRSGAYLKPALDI